MVTRQDDGSVVLTRSRLFANKRVTRQETIWTNQGVRHAAVTVTSEPRALATTTTDLESDGLCLCLDWTVFMPSCTLEAVLCGDMMLCGGDNAWFIPKDDE